LAAAPCADMLVDAGTASAASRADVAMSLRVVFIIVRFL
jgi:hypothetical protein